MLDTFCCEDPTLAFFKNQLSAREFFVNSWINVKQFERLIVAKEGRISWGASDGDAVGIEGYLIACNGLFRFIGINQVGVALGPLKVRRLHEHATKHRLTVDELSQAKQLPLGLFFILLYEQFPWVDADQVLAVPQAMMVTLTGKIFFVPCGKFLIS